MIFWPRSCAVRGRGATPVSAPLFMSDAADRVVVTWEGAGEPIVLTLYGPEGELAAMPLSTTRALTLGKELIQEGASSIKVDADSASGRRPVLLGSFA